MSTLQVVLWFPRAGIGGVSLPLDQELVALGFPFHLPSILLVLRDCFYFPLFFTFNIVRWGISEVWTICFSLTIRRKKGGVEDIVYLPLRGELEPISEWIQHLRDFEWSLSF